MDRALSFNGHVNSICQRSFFIVKTIYEYRNTLNEEVKKTLTNSLVLSIPRYLDAVYGPFLTNFNKYCIQKIQNSCARYVKRLSRRDHVSEPVKELYNNKMDQQRFIHLSCIVHKIIFTKEPIYLAESLLRRSEVHDVNVRGHSAMCIPRHKTQLFKNCFYYLSSHVYNILPEYLKSLSIVQFKSRVKEYVSNTLLSL